PEGVALASVVVEGDEADGAELVFIAEVEDDRGAVGAGAVEDDHLARVEGVDDAGAPDDGDDETGGGDGGGGSVGLQPAPGGAGALAHDVGRGEAHQYTDSRPQRVTPQRLTGVRAPGCLMARALPSARAALEVLRPCRLGSSSVKSLPRPSRMS